MRNLILFSLCVLPLLACTSDPGELDADAVAAHNRGVALMGHFDFDAAARQFSELAERYPDRSMFQIDRAIAILNRQREGDEQLARAVLDDVLERDPENMRALYCRGLIDLRRGDPVSASSQLRAVAMSDPGDVDAAYFVGLSLMQQSKPEEALEWFERAIAGDPYFRSAYYKAFRAMQLLGRSDETTEIWNRFEELEHNPRARLAELKYTKMGAKAGVTAISASPAAPQPRPAGPRFAAPRALIAGVEPVEWTEGDGPGSITGADIDGDGRTDLFLAGALQGDAGPVNALCLADPDSGGFQLDREHPLAAVTDVNAALWGDVDNDGTTDVYLCRRGPNQLWLRSEDGGWTDATGPTSTDNGSWNTVDGALYDADHDGDLDLFLVNADGPNELLNNDRDGGFRPLAAERGLTGSGSASRSVVVGDIDADRDLDLIVVNERPPHEVYRNDLLWRYEPAEGWDRFTSATVAAALAGDLDADGRAELYGVDGAGALSRWQPDDGGVWQPTVLVSAKAADAPAVEAASRLSLADLDGSGLTKIIASGPDGRWLGPLVSPFEDDAEAAPLTAWTLVVMAPENGPALVGRGPGQSPRLWPPGPGRHRFATLDPSGMSDRGSALRSNSSGIGARFAVRVGARWTVLDRLRDHSGPGQGLQPLAVGLEQAERIDFVAIDWPDGVYQTELDLAAGEAHRITETQRQISSCPVVFAWDGERYAFVSDVLGVGGIGYLLRPGMHSDPRPRESLLLPPALLRPRDGKLALKLVEPMEEVTYLDAFRLVAYDLPPGWSMTLDERMGISGPEPSGRPLFYRRLVRPQRAVNDRGIDVTELIAHDDRRAAPPGELDRRFIGRLRDEHLLSVSFAEPIGGRPGQLVLLADGWVEYPYSQTNFAAWQADAGYHAPTIEARAGDGPWRVVLEQFGYPAGMPRQMALPLPPLPPDIDQLRLRTNLEVYWDRLAVVWAGPCPEAERRELPLLGARLERSGFPRRSDGPQRLPGYDFDRRTPFWDTRFLQGMYTEFGPVTELVADNDDAVAVFGPGEAVHFDFADDAPLLRPGWSRVHLLEADGWCKDADRYTRHGETIEPVPSAGRDTDRRQRLHRQYNTRYVSGTP